jgi:preprotein translocase subunit SecE
MAYPSTAKEKYTESVDEWKSCLAQGDKFDGYLIKLRESGFSLITGIITATGFLGTKQESAIIQVGVAVVTGFLLWILWRVDQYYQDFVFATVARGEVLEKICKRKLIHTMSTYAWGNKNNLRRNTRMVIIYLGFLGALSAVGFIFYWNATDVADLDDESEGDGGNVTNTYYIKTVQLGADSTEINMIDEHIVRFFTSPLFGLPIVGFSLVASQIIYSYYKVDKKRRTKYEDLYKYLAKYDRKITSYISAWESLKREIDEISNNIEQTQRKISRQFEISKETVREGETRLKELRNKMFDLERKQKSEEDEEAKRERYLNELQDDISNLITQ